MSEGEKPRPKAPTFTKWISAICFLTFYVPLITMVVFAFLDENQNQEQVLLFTTRWFTQVFDNPKLMEALNLSILIAFLSTIISTIIGTMAAFALERFDFKLKKVIDFFSNLPLVVPDLVLGLSLLIWFVMLHLSLGMISMTLAHATMSITYIILSVRTRLNDFDHALEEAAYDLGASSTQVFWKVTFPLTLPGIMTGALMAFTLSFDDFLISFFTAGVGNDTLPLKIYSMLKFGISPEINALSTVVLAATFALVFIIFRPWQNKRIQF